MENEAKTSNSLVPKSPGKATITLDNGYRGIVSSVDPTGRVISADDWKAVLKGLENLLESPKKVLKSDGSTTVAIYDLDISGKIIPVVIKSHIFKPSIKNIICRSFRDKSFRNFLTADKLCDNQIPVIFPLAALKQKQGLSTIKSVYVTEYSVNSSNLHDFISDNLSNSSPDVRSFEIKKQLGSQIAAIFAGLDKAGLWHRDAKAGNFLVTCKSQTDLKVSLVDMDGIKRNVFRTDNKRYRGLAKLASTLNFSGAINMTDYLRSFMIYCNLTSIYKSKCRVVFRRISRLAPAMRLMTLAKSAMNTKQGR